MKISKVVIRNFKRFSDETFDLDGHVVVAGPNNSGKTTLLQAVATWSLALRGEGGVSRVTMKLLNYWRREGREHRLFFAQLEAAETVVFLTEARAEQRRTA